MNAGTQAEISRTSNERLKLPPIVTYVTRLPIPSSPSGTSLSFLNQSSTITHDRRSSSIVTPACSPSPQPVHRGVPDEATADDRVEPSDNRPPPVGGEVDGSPKPQQRRPSGIRSTLSCSQLLAMNARHHAPLVTVNSNPSLIPRGSGGDDRQRDGLSPVSSALTRRIRSSRTSVRSAGELESVKNFYSLSAPTSMSSVHRQRDDWPSWNDWIVQPGMLKKLTQIEDEMDECLRSVDADDDVVDTVSSLRRTYSENVRGTSAGDLNGDDGCRVTVATSKSDQTLSWHCSWTQTRRVGDRTATSGMKLIDDDDSADGGVFLDVAPVTAAQLVITSSGADICELSHRQTDVTEYDSAATDGPGSSGNYVSGLARSRSDVTSQRRFHRRRSAARYPTGLAPAAGLYVSASHLLAPRHGHSCSAIGDSLHCDATAPDSSDDSPNPEVNEQQKVLDALSVGHGDSKCPSFSRQPEAFDVKKKRCMSESTTSSVKDQQPVYDEPDDRQCSLSESSSRQFAEVKPETDVNALSNPGQRRSTARSILKTTRSSQSLDVAITVEVCDADADHTDIADGNLPGTPRRTCPINIPPVTISSHTSSPDDESADQKYVIAMTSSPTGDWSSQFISVMSSPAAQSRLNESNPNFLSVSRTGTFSSGGSTRVSSRRTSSHQSVAEPQDIISVDSDVTLVHCDIIVHWSCVMLALS